MKDPKKYLSLVVVLLIVELFVPVTLPAPGCAKLSIGPTAAEAGGSSRKVYEMLEEG